MNGSLREFLDSFYASNKAHDDALADRLERWRNIEPESAELLGCMIRSARPASLLEIGTSNGYGACWMADAARAVGGQFTSIEADPLRVEAAGATLRAAGLEGSATLLCADAATFLRETPDASYDFVLLDAERPEYPGYWPDLQRVMRQGATLVIDNVVSHAEQVRDFLPIVKETHIACTVPIGAGLFVAVKD